MALLDYPGGEEGEVSFVKGDIIIIKVYSFIFKELRVFY